jgi:hypothetical protein
MAMQAVRAHESKVQPFHERERMEACCCMVGRKAGSTSILMRYDRETAMHMRARETPPEFECDERSVPCSARAMAAELHGSCSSWRRSQETEGKVRKRREAKCASAAKNQGASDVRERAMNDRRSSS